MFLTRSLYCREWAPISITERLLSWGSNHPHKCLRKRIVPVVDYSYLSSVCSNPLQNPRAFSMLIIVTFSWFQAHILGFFQPLIITLASTSMCRWTLNLDLPYVTPTEHYMHLNWPAVPLRTRNHRQTMQSATRCHSDHVFACAQASGMRGAPPHAGSLGPTVQQCWAAHPASTAVFIQMAVLGGKNASDQKTGPGPPTPPEFCLRNGMHSKNLAC